MFRPIYVINSLGEKEPFSFRKVYRAARRVGASKNLAKEIAGNMKREIYPGITTSEIFRSVKKKLTRGLPQAAIRFNLKRGMRKLGPTGFPFEKYIGEIFEKNGFRVQINQNIPGLCCVYEIDFLAKKEDVFYIGECKYRNLAGGRVNLDIALANHARFIDIKQGRFFTKVFKKVRVKSLLVTNNKFTSEAAKYSRCVGVELLGWNYPKNQGLEYLIEKQKLYPITVLPSLKSHIADIFVSKKMMLVQDVAKINIQKFSQEFKIPPKYLYPMIKEAKLLLES